MITRPSSFASRCQQWPAEGPWTLGAISQSSSSWLALVSAATGKWNSAKERSRKDSATESNLKVELDTVTSDMEKRALESAKDRASKALAAKLAKRDSVAVSLGASSSAASSK